MNRNLFVLLFLVHAISIYAFRVPLQHVVLKEDVNTMPTKEILHGDNFVRVSHLNGNMVGSAILGADDMEASIPIQNIQNGFYVVSLIEANRIVDQKKVQINF